RAQALSDETLVSFEVDQPDAASGADDAVAVGALQGRARDDALPAGSASLVDPPRDCLEPRPAVLVGERHTAAHLLDVLRRMEAIGIAEWPAQAGRPGLPRL